MSVWKRSGKETPGGMNGDFFFYDDEVCDIRREENEEVT